MFVRGYQSWWVWGIRGFIAVMFGLIEFFYPAPTLLLAVVLYGAFNKIDGLLSIMISAYWMGTSAAFPLVAAGAVGVLTGAFALLWPSLHENMIALVLGCAGIVRGGLELVHVMRVRARLHEANAAIVAAAMIGAYGIVIFAGSRVGLRSLVMAFAAYATVAGMCYGVTAVRLRSIEHATPAPRSQAEVG